MTRQPKGSGQMLRDDEGEGFVAPIELLFDLVYVFTIIRLSHYVIADFDTRGVAEATVLFLAVWWGWNYTAWAMNWLNPHARRVQLLLGTLMLAALAMAIAIPAAFADRAAIFVGGYLALQLGRSAVMVWVFRGRVMGRNYAQLLTWSGFAGVFWVAGLFVGEELRLAVWALAVVVDYAGPRMGFWLPGWGATRMSSWPVAESHLAERSRLVFIIALGESILVLGGNLVSVALEPEVVLAAVVGFATMFLLWWLYFDDRHGNAEHALETPEVTVAARGAYAYAHALMVGGAIWVAVGIEAVLANPTGTSPRSALAVVVGPIVYLIGNLLFERALWRRTALSRLLAMGLLVLVGIQGWWLPALAVSTLAVVVLVGLAVVDHRTSERTDALVRRARNEA